MFRTLTLLLTIFSLFYLIPAIAQSNPSPAKSAPAKEDPVQIKHMVVFGNAHSDTGNTRTLFDELAGRKKPSRLRKDIRYHGPDTIDAASSVVIATLLWLPIWYLGWDTWIDEMPLVSSLPVPSRVLAISLGGTVLYQTGIGHWISKPLDLLIDRYELILNSLLWLYPAIGLPVLPPGQIYDRGGRFTNSSRVWSEMLALSFGLDPDKPSDFISLAYAGSHIRQRLSEDDMLSFGDWVTYMDIGAGLAGSIFSKGASSSERESFWGRAAENMSEDGRVRFESLLKDGVPPSFEFMVDDYGNRKKYSGVREPEATLYIICYGADDYIIDDAAPEDVIESLENSLDTLITRDRGQYFLISEIRNPVGFPLTRNFSEERKRHIRDRVDAHNFMLEQLIKKLQDSHPEIKVTLLYDDGDLSDLTSVNKLSSEPCLRLAGKEEMDTSTHSIIRVPSLSNTTPFTQTITRDGSSLYAAGRFVGQTVARCNNPEQYFFYDDFNLTARGHRLISEAVCQKMKSAGYKVICSDNPTNSMGGK